ncbi:MAG: hypothetical protein Q9169_003623 [Polycauliona sp. 2 TL-2023]
MTSTRIPESSLHDEARRSSVAPAAPKGLEGIEPDFVDLDEWDWEEREEELVEVVDEGEMKKLVLGRVGGWVDWMVGWMDWRGLGDDDDGVGEGNGNDEMVEEEVGGEGNEKRKWREDDGGESGSFSGLPPPEAAGGTWEDAKWLLKIAANSL